MELLVIEDLLWLTFISRENRFTVKVKLDSGDEVLAHLKDTAKLKDYLIPGNKLLGKLSPSKSRKTQLDIWAGLNRSTGELILINSWVHPTLASEILRREGYIILKREVKLPKSRSRFDLLVKNSKGTQLVEVKGCTLYRGEYALFPDALTQRGRRHVRELTELVRRGERARLLFLAFSGRVKYLTVNEEIDPELRRMLREFLRVGGEISAYTLPLELNISGDRISLKIKSFAPLELEL